MGADWPRRRLDEIATLRNRKIVPASDDRRPYVALEHIASGGRLLGHGQARESISQKTVFCAADTLFGKLRPNLRKVVSVDFDGVCSTDILALSPDDSDDAPFLGQLLRSDRAYAYAMRGITGTKMPRTSWKHLRAYAFPFPPPDERRAISAVLDAIDDAIERMQAVIAETERFRKALLQELLTRGVPGWHSEWKQVPGLGTVPACWDVAPLADTVEKPRYGTSAKLSANGRGYPVLRIPNVVRGSIDTSEVKFADVTAREAEMAMVRAGDLLVVRTNGNPGFCGQSSIFKGLDGDWLFASYLIRVRVDPARMVPTYLWLFLRSGCGRKQLRANIRTSAGNYNLSVAGLLSMGIPLPPIPEQERIATISNALDESLARLRMVIRGLAVVKSAAASALLSGHVRVPIRGE